MRIVLVLAALVPLALAGFTLSGCPKANCSSNDDCLEDGTFCADDAGEGRTCVKGCAADLPCLEGQACIARDDGSFEGVCLAITDDAPDGNACTSDLQCASGACLGEEGVQVCVAVCAVGETCPTATDLCTLEGLRHVCVPPLDTRDNGEVCASPRECLSGTCVIPPNPGATQALCTEACSDDVACETASDVCVRLAGGGRACLAPLEDGALCQGSGACAGGFCVRDLDDVTKCASACSAGACAEGYGCQPDADGTNDLCLPVLDTRESGETCESARECLSGQCANFAGIGTLCADPCDSEGECNAPLVCWSDDAGTDVCGPNPEE